MLDRIVTHPTTHFAGKKASMSFDANTTAQLWQAFMPQKSKISEPLEEALFSIECYPDLDFFSGYFPTRLFDKWAAMAIAPEAEIPDGMERLVVPEGLYAVFIYRGLSSEAGAFYRHIFMQWFPSSEYALDHRPHFAKMDHRYKNNDPDSEEEIWIPIVRSV